VTDKATRLDAERIIELSKRYTLFDWVAQSKVSPIAVDRAEGIYFWDVDGKRYIDFNSQLMGVNIGHGDRRVIDAMHEQAKRLTYISPFMAYEERALLGQKMAELLPGDIEKTFYTLGGAEANENAIKIARMVTGRHKIMARYRSYHGATAGAMTLTGDPRRWANEPSMSGVVHVLDPYHGPDQPADDAATALARLEETIQLEGANTIAAFFLETVTGTNGILIPPDGYLQGVRDLCTKYGILMVSDEVMCGFGRTGEWFAVDHWDVVPDIISCAKGLTSSYAPLGALGIRPDIAEYFQEHVFWGGLTYNTHPLGVAAALATIAVYEQDGLIDHARKMGDVMARHHRELMDKHPSVGAVRNIGLFGALDLVKNRGTMEPISAFNTTSETMASVSRYLIDHGLYTMTHWWTLMTNPPLPITEEQLAEGFEIIDGALEIADAAVEG
jgi:taurine--2-oxoglutarate transaminase